ncbi:MULTISPECIES: ATP-binding protein [Bacillus]|uniref:ATP-binding protein n=1 Tax=Bacillus TaxID=1386 RepID=UPI0009E4CC80|nr:MULTISPECIES: ATP-binding protein [Bacillus]MDU0073101.1 ATP-binding protein [Bacillus sp. IG6]
MKDTGIGISKTDLPYIFNRFYKANKARIRKKASSGLGFAITKKLLNCIMGKFRLKAK